MTGPFLPPNQIPLLEGLASNSGSSAIQRRARILLLYNAGKNTREIAEEVGLALRSVRYWRREYIQRGIDIFPANNGAEQSEKLAERPVPAEPESTGSSKEVEAELTPERRPARRKPLPVRRPYPRVRKNPGIKPDDLMAEAGRKILRFHFANMLSHEKGTRLGEDIEELHHMRVATRRMRAAYEVFKPFFKPKAIKKHLKGLRATGRVLGRVRDLDVILEKAGDYLERLTEGERPGLKPLLTAWQEERATAREKMQTHLDSESYQQFKRDFNDFTSTPGEGARPISRDDPRPDQVRQIVPVLVYTNLASVRAYEPIIPNATIEQLHALRIEFKKLRYTLEFFNEVLGKQSREVIDELKALQDHLGDLHDADVACRLLRDFIEIWEERQVLLPLYERQNPEPVVAYLAVKHAERYKLLVAFPQAWAHFNRPESLENLALAVSVL